MTVPKFYHRVMGTEDVDVAANSVDLDQTVRRANSVDPDQTAPRANSLDPDQTVPRANSVDPDQLFLEQTV